MLVAFNFPFYFVWIHTGKMICESINDILFLSRPHNTHTHTNTCRNVISTWSSGTGAAGLFGALTYAGLLAIGLSAKNTMLLMLVVPVIQAVAFFILLRPPRNCVPRSSNSSVASIVNDPGYYTSFDAPNPRHLLDQQQHQLQGFGNKLRYMPKLLKYIAPLFFVYLFEYFINMGLVSHLLNYERSNHHTKLITHF